MMCARSRPRAKHRCHVFTRFSIRHLHPLISDGVFGSKGIIRERRNGRTDALGHIIYFTGTTQQTDLKTSTRLIDVRTFACKGSAPSQLCPALQLKDGWLPCIALAPYSSTCVEAQLRQTVHEHSPRRLFSEMLHVLHRCLALHVSLIIQVQDKLRRAKLVNTIEPVSYTHLTLPTKRIV